MKTFFVSLGLVLISVIVLMSCVVTPAVYDEHGNVIQPSVDVGHYIEDGVAIVTPFLPPPFNVVVPSLAGLMIGLGRAWYVKSTAKNVIRSVDPIIHEAIEKDVRVAFTLNQQQTPSGKRLVDEAQGSKVSLPF
jgi:hypothetical protein